MKNIRRDVPIIVVTGAKPIRDEALGRVDAWIIKGESKPEDLLNTLAKLIR